MNFDTANRRHTIGENSIVFDDVFSRSAVRCRIIAGFSLLISAFAIPWGVELVMESNRPPVQFSLLGIGIFMLAWEAHAKFLKRAHPGQRGLVIIDETGIHGDAVKDRQGCIEWSRLREIRIDQRAIIARFDPRDFASRDPKDRISEIRLASTNAKPEEIEAAIRRFWKPPSGAQQQAE